MDKVILGRAAGVYVTRVALIFVLPTDCSVYHFVVSKIYQNNLNNEISLYEMYEI